MKNELAGSGRHGISGFRGSKRPSESRINKLLIKKSEKKAKKYEKH